VVRIEPKSLPLILAREFASNLASPLAIFDQHGSLVFFNEPAERIVGRTHAQVGELAPDEWETLFKVERLDGTPMPAEETPVGVAFAERRPVHDSLTFKTLDGRRWAISVTAFPLLERREELAGVVALFWGHVDA
jgi:PAS domain-containing protein